MATDTELNQYLSVKKYAPYRKDTKWDNTRMDRLKDLKQSVAERSRGVYGMDSTPGQNPNEERQEAEGKEGTTKAEKC